MAGAGASHYFAEMRKVAAAARAPPVYERVSSIGALRLKLAPYGKNDAKPTRNSLHNLVAAVMKGDVSYDDFETLYKSDRDQGLLELVNKPTKGNRVPLELVFADERGFISTTCNTTIDNGNKLITLLWPDMTEENKQRVRDAAKACPKFTLPGNGGYRRRKSRKSRQSRQSRKSRKTRRH